jgi:hypothetical protein
MQIHSGSVTITPLKEQIDENVLINIADVLWNLAAFESGRTFLLHGEINYQKRKKDPGVRWKEAKESQATPLHAVALLVSGGFGASLLNNSHAEVKVPSTSGGSNAASVSVAAIPCSTNSSKQDPASKIPTPTIVPSIVPYRILGSFLFFLRQLYRTCLGVLQLHSYKLHSVVASHHKQIMSDLQQVGIKESAETSKVLDSMSQFVPGNVALPSMPSTLPPSGASAKHSATPTPCLNSTSVAPLNHTSSTFYELCQSKTCIRPSDVSWGEWHNMCLDNLLNFAATPKGVLLLHESGLMNKCVAHMFERYKMKLQVSCCEKFGYGVLVSQLAATAPGARALYQTGLVECYVKELWSILYANGGSFPEVLMKNPSITFHLSMNSCSLY